MPQQHLQQKTTVDRCAGAVEEPAHKQSLAQLKEKDAQLVKSPTTSQKPAD